MDGRGRLKRKRDNFLHRALEGLGWSGKARPQRESINSNSILMGHGAGSDDRMPAYTLSLEPIIV